MTGVCVILVLVASYLGGKLLRQKDYEKLYEEQNKALIDLNSTVVAQYERIKALEAIIEEYRKIIKND